MQSSSSVTSSPFASYLAAVSYRTPVPYAATTSAASSFPSSSSGSGTELPNPLLAATPAAPSFNPPAAGYYPVQAQAPACTSFAPVPMALAVAFGDHSPDSAFAAGHRVVQQQAGEILEKKKVNQSSLEQAHFTLHLTNLWCRRERSGSAGVAQWTSICSTSLIGSSTCASDRAR
ncbi:hypothetical protein VTO42DRAFT_5396 [Malbranchea cinnamomea]